MERQIEEYGILSPAKMSGSSANLKLIVALVGPGQNVIGYVYYIPDRDALPDSSIDASNVVSMYKHVSQAAIDVDMLRNEAPVYVAYYSPTRAWLQTGSEPIGEAELRA